MQFPSFFSHYTIRQRLILLNYITISLIIALVSIYSYQLVSLEHKLVIMEQTDDLFNSILELRRYEKNILLQLEDEDNLSRAEQSLEGISALFKKLSPKIKELPGNDLFLSLQDNFREYRDTFANWCADEDCVQFAAQREENIVIRQLGQELVDNAAELDRINRKYISQGFKKIFFWLTFIPVVIFVSGAIIFFTHVKNILNRLSSLQKATRDMAAGEIKPIPTLKNPDEITELVISFNKAVYDVRVKTEELKQKQEELIQSKKMATIGTFSSGIAHEINNPLNNISLSTDTLLEEFDSMDEEEIKEILEDIMAQTERASKIVRNLLDFSRAKSSETEPLYIDFILHKTIDLIENELNIHKITLEKYIDDNLPMINGDLQKLQQVFLNLIINAEQAIGENGKISVHSLETDNGYIRTSISDNGPGIAPEHLSQIFDPFFTTKEAGQGTGLGLSIVYGIVKKHGGYIEVASELGEGTTFSVYLPVYRENEEQKSND